MGAGGAEGRLEGRCTQKSNPVSVGLLNWVPRPPRGASSPPGSPHASSREGRRNPSGCCHPPAPVDLNRQARLRLFSQPLHYRRSFLPSLRAAIVPLVELIDCIGRYSPREPEDSDPSVRVPSAPPLHHSNHYLAEGTRTEGSLSSGSRGEYLPMQSINSTSGSMAALREGKNERR